MLLALILSAIAVQEAPTAEQVVVRLISPDRELKPGATIEVDAHFKIVRGWHIYWENPGDSGLATHAKLSTPSGFSVSGPEFPSPERIEAPGTIVEYVHQRDLVLFFHVVVPKDFVKGTPVTFSLAADWLVCKESCMRGSGKSDLSFAGEPRAALSAEDARLVESQRARLPKLWKELAGAELAWAAVGAQRSLSIRIPGADECEFFPARSEILAFRGRECRAEGLTIAYELPDVVPPGDAAVAQAKGVVRVRRGDSVSFYSLAAALTAAK